LCKAAEVWSAGFGVNEAAAGPSPLPFSPWQGAQLVIYSVLASFSIIGVETTGFFTARAIAGATHTLVCAFAAAAINTAVKTISADSNLVF